MRQSFITFDADPNFVQMYFTTELARATRRCGRPRRIEAIQAALHPITSGLDDARRRGAEAVIAYLASIQAWLTIREEFCVSGPEVGECVG
jgi:hypothetical protein